MGRRITISLIAWSCWSASRAIAQDPAAPVPAAAATGTAAAPPVAKLESNDPSVLALLSTNPRTPKDIFEITNLLLELGNPDLARAMLVRLTETATAPEELVEFGRTVGKREVLRLGEVAAFQPEGKPFAEKVIAAMSAADRDPARIASLIQQLQSPSYDARVAAINNLRAGGDGAMTALVEGLLDPNRAAEHLMLRTALAAFGEPAVGPARAMIASKDEAVTTAGVKTLALIEGPVVLNDLYAAAHDRNLPAASRQAAAAALTQRSSQAISAADVALRLYLAADHLYKKPSLAAEQGAVFWDWNALEKKPLAHRGTTVEGVRADELRQIRRLADVAADMTDGESVPRLLASAASLELIVNHSSDSRFMRGDLKEWQQERKLTPADLRAVFEQVAVLGRNETAARLITHLGESGDAASLLTSPDGRTTLLARAAVSPDPTIRFAAVEAIVFLKPKAFPGSSGVADSLAWFASSDGVDRALVVDPYTERGRDVASLLTGMNMQAEATNRVLDAVSKCTADADLQVIFAHRLALEPAEGNFLARLRQDYRTARTPVVILCEAEDLDRTRTRHYADPYTFAIIRPATAEHLVTQMKMIPELGRLGRVAPVERQRRAQFALGFMQQLAAGKNKVFDFRPYEKMLLAAVNSPTRGVTAIGVLAFFGSPDAQRTLADVASETARPLELRQAAAKAFAMNVRQYGKLLTTDQIARQYERYNASETLDKPTQQLLSSILDVLEGKQAAVAEPLPPAPTTVPAANPTAAPEAPAAPSAPALNPSAPDASPAAVPPAAPAPAATP